MFFRYFVVIFLFIIPHNLKSASTVSPLQYGLKEAVTAIDRYWVLYRTHLAAKELGKDVSYCGIDSLEIEIPTDGKSIPLTHRTDFSNLKLNVKNNSKKIYLFELRGNSSKIHIDAKMVDSGDFSMVPQLNNGVRIVFLQDDNKWVDKRRGHNYGHIRKDILYVKNGRALNKPISTYNNNASKVSASYRVEDEKNIYFGNLKFYRKEENKQVVNLVFIDKQSNIMLRNIECYTPDDYLTDDHVFSVYNCVNVRFDNVKIQGTYSHIDHSGYGIAMNNVWNVSFKNLVGHGNWGIFGTSNVSFISLKKCDINRFDIHCYGKDIFFKDVIFRDLYNQFASTYGTVSFDKCKFIDFIPVGFGKSYNAYTSFDLYFRNCEFYSPVRNICFLIKTTGIFDSEINKRPELSVKGWPNISIKGMKIYSQGDKFGRFYLFNFGLKINFDKIPSKIDIKNLEFFPNRNVKFLRSSFFAPFTDANSIHAKYLLWMIRICTISLFLGSILLFIRAKRYEKN